MASGFDAYIVCGGRGSRLGPVGAVVNKCLLPFDGKPIVQLVLEQLSSGFDCRSFTFLTGHLGGQVEGLVRSLPVSQSMSFVADDGRGTLPPLLSATAEASGPFVYSHANIALGRGAWEQTLTAAQRLEPGESLMVVGDSTMAPTHPHLDVAGDVVNSVGPASPAHPIASVGLAIYDSGVFAGVRSDTGPDTPVEYGLSSDVLRAGRVRSIDIGSDWFHLEDLTSYRGFDAT